MWARVGPYGPTRVARGEKRNVKKVKIIISDSDLFRGLCPGGHTINNAHTNKHKQLLITHRQHKITNIHLQIILQILYNMCEHHLKHMLQICESIIDSSGNHL